MHYQQYRDSSSLHVEGREKVGIREETKNIGQKIQRNKEMFQATTRHTLVVLSRLSRKSGKLTGYVLPREYRVPVARRACGRR